MAFFRTISIFSMSIGPVGLDFSQPGEAREATVPKPRTYDVCWGGINTIGSGLGFGMFWSTSSPTSQGQPKNVRSKFKITQAKTSRELKISPERTSRGTFGLLRRQRVVKMPGAQSSASSERYAQLNHHGLGCSNFQCYSWQNMAFTAGTTVNSWTQWMHNPK